MYIDFSRRRTRTGRLSPTWTEGTIWACRRSRSGLTAETGNIPTNVTPDLLQEVDLLSCRDSLRPETERKQFLFPNIEQWLTAIVPVKLYEYSVNMCQQRQYYFKDYGWKILAVYINIYYLYFVFEIADMEKVEIFIALKI